MSEGDFHVVAAGQHHAPIIARLQWGSLEEVWSAEAIAGLLALPQTFAFIAIAGGGPAGFILCWTAGGESEVLAFAVAAEHRRCGCGRILLAAALQKAFDEGVRRAVLEVSATNSPAQALYTRFGFRVVGRRSGYYQRPGQMPVDALILAVENDTLAATLLSHQAKPMH
jgi:ribosomal-protein-alanine N-acetyltransferase